MDKKNIAFWIMIVFIFSLGIYLIFYIQSESYQCMNNPYTYSVRLLEKSNDAPVSCLCSAQKTGSSPVLLTRDGFSKIEAEESNNTFVVNYSGFINS